MGIVSTRDLTRKDTLAFGEQYYQGGGMIGYTDPWYNPPLAPIYCIDKSLAKWGLTDKQIAGPDICFYITSFGISVAIGKVFRFYPIFDSLNWNSNNKEACRCTAANDYGCNNPDLFIGLVFDKGGDSRVFSDVDQVPSKQH